MNLLANNGRDPGVNTDGGYPAATDDVSPVDGLNNLTGLLPNNPQRTPRLTLRLSAADLRCGGLVSTADGNAHYLWQVEAVSPGAGDGCMELTLKLHEPTHGNFENTPGSVGVLPGER